ncbi:MLO-like protein 1 [Vigna radiata var. radiata]|uniref:MLO-like protein 1 n=1 Tax=Vigna radiata var. radiata TaxID=3916 RepID=A0A1S3UNF1_VIGRR|nr:MLO-like protein 1 [Vigna radiata var. radiata]
MSLRIIFYDLTVNNTDMRKQNWKIFWIRQRKHWEDSIAKKNYETNRVLKPKETDDREHDFIRGRFSGFGKDSAIVGWMISFSKHFYGYVTKSYYVILRHGFIMNHCKSNPKFNFHKYMICPLKDDFKQVFGISPEHSNARKGKGFIIYFVSYVLEHPNLLAISELLLLLYLLIWVIVAILI